MHIDDPTQIAGYLLEDRLRIYDEPKACPGVAS